MTKSRIEQIVEALPFDERRALISAICLAYGHEEEFRRRFGGLGWNKLVEMCPPAEDMSKP